MENHTKKVMLVEDNHDLLLNFHLILEDHKFKVTTAKDGKEALNILSDGKFIPDIIISDIMMPEVDGYDLLKIISTMPKYSHIPFIFLTALSLSKDVQYAKELGADEFLVKPIEEEDLIRIINEKLSRKQLAAELYDQFEKEIKVPKTNEAEMQKSTLIKKISLIYAIWDDKLGPVIQRTYPRKKNISIPVDKVTIQLFHAANLIYGHDSISESESLLLNLKNIERNCFLFLDSHPALNERQGKQIYMLAVIAPSINYLNSLKLKEVFKDLTTDIKNKYKSNKKNLLFRKYWNLVVDILD